MDAQLERSRLEIAGNVAAAGLSIVTGVSALNWLDCLRVRYQVTPHADAVTVRAFARGVVRSEGLVNGLWRQGLFANAAAAGSSYALRVGTYPVLRDALVLALEGEGGRKTGRTMFAAGFASGLMGFWLSTPLWQIKTRMHAEAGQVDAATGKLTTGARAGSRPHFRGVMHGLRRLAGEGAAQAWHGALPLVVRGALLSGGQQLGYDGTKTFVKEKGLMEDGFPLHVVAAIVSAFCSCTFSAPFDVLLTRYQAGTPGGEKWRSLRECAGYLVESQGKMVFFRGWRCLPAACCSFSSSSSCSCSCSRFC